MPKHLSDKVDEFFLHLWADWKLFHQLSTSALTFRYDPKTSFADKFLIYALFISKRICKGKE